MIPTWRSILILVTVCVLLSIVVNYCEVVELFVDNLCDRGPKTCAYFQALTMDQKPMTSLALVEIPGDIVTNAMSIYPKAFHLLDKPADQCTTCGKIFCDHKEVLLEILDCTCPGKGNVFKPQFHAFIGDPNASTCVCDRFKTSNRGSGHDSRLDGHRSGGQVYKENGRLAQQNYTPGGRRDIGQHLTANGRWGQDYLVTPEPLRNLYQIQPPVSSSSVQAQVDEPGSRVACKYCKSNKESIEFQMTHKLYHRGIVICPILRQVVCSICLATGDHAHTIKYCPFQPTAAAHKYNFTTNSFGKQKVLRF